MTKICIVGGGTAGWFAAAYLAKEISHLDVNITLVESGDIPTIGVGESVTPHVVSFLVDSLSINEKEWMQDTGAIFKLANRFIDWKYPGHSEYFSFAYPYPESLAIEGRYPNCIDEFTSDGSALTTDLYLNLHKKGILNKFDKYFNPQYNWMEQQKFHIDNLHLPYGVSHHINADLTTEFVKEKIALPNGVTHVRGTVDRVVVNDGVINSIILDDGALISADFFVDCTGFRRRIISELTEETKDYNYPIDRAVVGRTPYKSPETEMTNYTQTIAKDYGWIFRVTLENRIGNGFCYSSSYTTDDQAIEVFEENFDITPRKISWTPQRLVEPCKSNVVCVGLSNGFIEPLEANNLYVIISSVKLAEKFIRKALTYNILDNDEFNNKINFALDDIHDFLLVHYTLADNNRSELWADLSNQGIKENHVDLVYEKFKDPKNNMLAGFKGQTLFPDYMWLQLACSWGLDISKWDPLTSKHKTEEIEYYFRNTYQENLEKSATVDNFYIGYKNWLCDK